MHTPLYECTPNVTQNRVSCTQSVSSCAHTFLECAPNVTQNRVFPDGNFRQQQMDISLRPSGCEASPGYVLWIEKIVHTV